MIEAFQTLDNGTLVDYALDSETQCVTIRAGATLHPEDRQIALVLSPADAVQLMRVLRDLYTQQPVDLSRLDLSDRVVDAFLDSRLDENEDQRVERVRQHFERKLQLGQDWVTKVTNRDDES